MKVRSHPSDFVENYTRSFNWPVITLLYWGIGNIGMKSIVCLVAKFQDESNFLTKMKF